MTPDPCSQQRLTFNTNLWIQACEETRLLGAQIRADARITFAPLVDTLPCLGAVTVSLLDPPYIDLSLSLIGGINLMALPGLREGVFAAANMVSARAKFVSLIIGPPFLNYS